MTNPNEPDDLTRAFPGIPAELVHEAAEAGQAGRLAGTRVQPANRWAAFTDDELDALGQAVNDHHEDTPERTALLVEIVAEGDRRADQDHP